MDNAQIKHLVRLMEKTRYRRETGLYIAEGPRMAREIPPAMLDAVYFSPHFEETYPADAAVILQTAEKAGARTEVLSDAVFSKISGTVTPQGILCVVRQRRDTLEMMLRVPAPRCMLVLEGIQDPGNLGTMLRTGEAAGIAGIIADTRTADLYHPKVVRGTMGAVLRVPYLVVRDLPACVRQLQASGMQTAAASPQADCDLYEAPLSGDIAFLIGNEGNGLSEDLMQTAELEIRIPMEGSAESLNAAVSAALCMYEAKRRRDYTRIC